MTYDYRETLRNQLEQRMQRSSSYSLRAFARDLDINPSRLSEILNHKRGVSSNKALQLSQRLSLSTDEQNRFILSAQALHGRSKKLKDQAAKSLLEKQKESKLDHLSEDKFSLISSWYHYAILELLATERTFKCSEEIAKCFNINEIQSKQALKRLQKLGLVKFENDKYKALTDTSFTSDDVPSKALKAHHEQNLNLAIEALYCQKVEDREIGSTTIAVRKDQVREIKELIKEFRTKIAAIADNSDSKDCVYLLGTQFFRLDKENKNV